MKHILHSLIAVAVLTIATAFSANAQQTKLYACGSFNGWNPSSSLEFNYEDGVYILSLDFSQNDTFKISTVQPSAELSTSDQWIEFDSGSLNPAISLALNTPAPLVAGTKNIQAPSMEPLDVIVDLENMTITLSNGGEAQKPWSGTLPVMFINTQDNTPVTSKEEYLKATWWLDPMGDESVKALGSEEAPLTLQIKGRGNYTWIGFDKKPYRLKLDTKEELLGMQKSKHFALLAHADDKTGFMRNPVGFWLSQHLGLPWTPAQQPVEVVLNGEYIGLYFATETIRVDKDRVNIVEQPDEATDPSVITGGWLVEIDNYDTDPHVTVASGDGYDIWFTYKSPELLSQQQETYLYDQMKNLDDLIYGDKNSDELWKYLDIDDAARFYIVQEVTDNVESYHGSCYLFKDQGDDAKWHFSPVWDFGASINYPKEETIAYSRVWRQVWIPELVKFPAFVQRVKDIWLQFAASDYNDIYTYVTDYSTKIARAAVCDFVRWPEYGNLDEVQKGQQVANWLQGSQTWCFNQWGVPDNAKEYTIYFVDHSQEPWANVYCYVWDQAVPGINGYYEPLGGWPGREMEPAPVGDELGYKLTFYTTDALSADTMVIFNNGGGGEGNQTGDTEFINRQIYIYEGSSVEALASDSIKVFATRGTLNIVSDKATTLPLTDLSGRSRLLHINAGTNTLSLPAGFYIVAGRKIFVKEQ